MNEQMTIYCGREERLLSLQESFDLVKRSLEKIFSGKLKFYFHQCNDPLTGQKKPRIAVCIAEETAGDVFKCWLELDPKATPPVDPDVKVYHRGVSICVPPDNPEKSAGKFLALQRLYRAVKQMRDKVFHLSDPCVELLDPALSDEALSSLTSIIFREDWKDTKGFVDSQFYALGAFETSLTEFEKKLFTPKKVTS